MKGGLLIAALASILAAGCAIPARTVQVEVPIPVPCIETVPPEPTYPADALTGAEDIDLAVRTLWADRLIRKGHTATLRATLEACRR